MVIFIDTSAIYALLDASDKNHERALAAWAEWLSQPDQFATSNYVLLESSALIQYPLGIAAVRAFYEEFVPVLQVHWVTADLQSAGVKTILAAAQRDFSSAWWTPLLSSCCAGWACIQSSPLTIITPIEG